jgi:hypothetical protein
MKELFETQPEPPQADTIDGEFVTETFDYDQGRRVTVYVPPLPPEAIVFAGDGQTISQWARFLEAADVPSTMIVGVHRAADETLGSTSIHRSIRSASPHTRNFLLEMSARGPDPVSA